jgi:uncharacterized surface protein with fasciclin (FAS1) repeats
MLQGKGPYTILAPTDKAANIEALKSKSPARVQNLVNSHILKGRIKSNALGNFKSVQTWNGRTLRVSKQKGTIHVGPATVVREDIICSNGVIQVVNAVMVPRGETVADHKKAPETKIKKKK